MLNLDVGDFNNPAPDLPFQLRTAGHVRGELVAQRVPGAQHVAGRTEVDAVRPVLQDGNPGGHHVVEQTGEQPVEFQRAAGHQQVNVAALRDGGAVARRARELVALEHRDPVVELGQHPRRAQPGEAGADHHSVPPDPSPHPSGHRTRYCPGTWPSRWRTKSIEQSIADTDEPDTQLRKDLSWWHLCVFGVSVVIGAGIFTVTASTAGDITGPAIWISFLIAAITCGLAALCYAEFASMLPVAGSAYTFSYATFGEFLAWTIGWNLVLELAIGGAVVAKGWSSYLQHGTRISQQHSQISVPLTLDWGALLIVALVATLLALGTKLSSQFSMVVTAVKVRWWCW